MCNAGTNPGKVFDWTLRRGQVAEGAVPWDERRAHTDAAPVLRQDSKGEVMEVQPRKPTAKAPAEWFTGDVWVDIITQGQGSMTIGFVHFTPGARTAWHSHAISQTLFVTEGEGRVQSRGEPVITIRPGEVVYTPGEEWHWHGAAPDHFMTHLAMTEGAAEWGDHVTDAEYRARAE